MMKRKKRVKMTTTVKMKTRVKKEVNKKVKMKSVRRVALVALNSDSLILKKKSKNPDLGTYKLFGRWWMSW